VLCAQCRTEIPPSRLACPVCHALVHAGDLKILAGQAEEASRRSDPSAELALWRQALDLLPVDAGQARTIASRVEVLSRAVDGGASAASAASPDGRPRSFREAWKNGGGLAALGLLAWKLKALLFLALSQGKLLLLGLKGGTALTMLLSLGVYWKIFGWPLAVGLIISIYIHEMGHVAALRRFGIAASAPMFIPGFGALVRLRQSPANTREDARVGLAGPLWGLGAAVAAWLVYRATGQPIWAAIAGLGAWINLFNLMPIWQLDGGRGFRALSRGQRIAAAVVIGAAYAFTREGMLLLLLVLAGASVFSASAAGQEGDRTALTQYAFLIAALSALCLLRQTVGSS
jgi:Zn-dependent protease